MECQAAHRSRRPEGLVVFVLTDLYEDIRYVSTAFEVQMLSSKDRCWDCKMK